MNDFRGKPSGWLLHNSKGYPDFLFTILTYSLLLLAFVSLTWISFGILAFIHAGSAKAEIMYKIVDNMKTGLISLAGVIFGLAGSYTVRRVKADSHAIQKKQLERNGSAQDKPGGISSLIQKGLKFVQDREDI